MPAPLLAQTADKDMLSYTVKPGDTLITLARQYFNRPGEYAEVQALNHIRDPRHIPVARQIVIPRRLLRFNPIELKLASFSGPVTIAAAQQGVAPRPGLVLAEGTELRTGAGGFVTLVGSEGSRFSLPSNSNVRIGRSRRYLLSGAADIALDIDRGKIEVRAAKQAPADSFRLRSPVAVSAVRGTVFRVAFADGAGASEVIEGAVGVASSSQDMLIPGGFGATVSATGALAKEALLTPPELLDIAKVQTDADVSFATKAKPGAARYHFQIARDASFTETLAETEGAEPVARFADIRNGTFFLRASAIAPSGLEGLTDTWSFRRQRVGLKADMGRSALANGFRVNWLAEGDGKSLYRFQLYADGQTATPLIDEAGMTDPGITLTGLKAGAYRWRVGVTQTSADGTAEVWTPLEKFTVGN